MDKELIRTSKFLSLVLRHDPGRIGLSLDPEGWASVEDLILRTNDFGHNLDHQSLRELVATNDKQRFAFSHDGTRIRATQGHSIDIDLGLESIEPPRLLFHGTAMRNLGSIRRWGLLPGSRQYVHLSPDAMTATRVGQRHGIPVVLKIAALRMYQEQLRIYRSANGVWLTAAVPVQYISFPT